MAEYFSIFLETQGRKREIKISKTKVIESENKTLNSKELLEIFDPETYRKYKNKSLSGKMIKSLERTVNQFYTNVKKIKDPKDKRKNLYILGKLHNSDGVPIKRINNRKKIEEFNFLFRILLIKILYTNSSFSNSKKLISWLYEFGFINQKYLDDFYDVNNKDKIYNGEHITIKELKEKEIIPFFTFMIKEKNADYIQSTELEDNESLIEKNEMSDKKAISLLNNYFNKVSSKLLYSLKSSLEYLYDVKLIDYTVEYIGELLVSNDKNYPIFEESILTDSEIQQYIYTKELVKKQMEEEEIYKFYNEKNYIKRLNEYIYNNGIETINGIKYFRQVSVVYNIKSKIDSENLTYFLSENAIYRQALLEDNENLLQNYRNSLVTSIINSNSNKFTNFNKGLEEMVEGAFGDVEDLFNYDMQKILNFKLMTNELEHIANKLINDRHLNNLEDKLSNLNWIINS